MGEGESNGRERESKSEDESKSKGCFPVLRFFYVRVLNTRR